MKQILKKNLKFLKNGMARFKMQRRLWTVAIIQFFFGMTTAFAQAGAGAGAFTEAASSIEAYQAPVQKLMYAIAAVIALVGAFNVYHKMVNGDQDVKKTIMLTLGGCIAMVALSTALPQFFK